MKQSSRCRGVGPLLRPWLHLREQTVVSGTDMFSRESTWSSSTGDDVVSERVRFDACHRTDLQLWHERPEQRSVAVALR